MDTKKVLEIGGFPLPKAKLIPGLENAEVTTLDIDKSHKPHIVADAAKMPAYLKGKYDAVLASHVLEHFSYWKTNDVVKGWIECLKEGGELHVIVPSLEWAAREVLSESPSPALYGQLYAGQAMNQWDVHLTGFTMRKLRQIFEVLGLSVTHAKTGIYSMRVGGYEKEFEAEQHYICGVRGTPVLKKE